MSVEGIIRGLYGDMPDLKGALCVKADPHDNPWFPGDLGPANSKRYKRAVAYAKSVCAECPRREPCAEWAIANPSGFGIWGGMTPKEITAERVRRDPSLKRAAA